MVYAVSFVEGVASFGLWAADNKISALFGFRQCVQMSTFEGEEVLGVKNDFDAHVGCAFTAVYYFGSQRFAQLEIEFVQHRVNFAIQHLAWRYFGYFNRHFLKSRNIYIYMYI